MFVAGLDLETFFAWVSLGVYYLDARVIPCETPDLVTRPLSHLTVVKQQQTTIIFA